MPRFSISSITRLETCHPELQFLFNTIIQTFDCSILIGHRDEVEQREAFQTGKSKLNWPDSKHNSFPSMAVDVSSYPIDWSNTKMFYWFAGYVLGIADQLFREGKMKYKIRWGGDWNHNFNLSDEKGLSDLVHFELLGA